MLNFIVVMLLIYLCICFYRLIVISQHFIKIWKFIEDNEQKLNVNPYFNYKEYLRTEFYAPIYVICPWKNYKKDLKIIEDYIKNKMK